MSAKTADQCRVLIEYVMRCGQSKKYEDAVRWLDDNIGNWREVHDTEVIYIDGASADD